ncbi:NAD-dependent succinate-semialdehyde dehydrogenase [Dongia soli]|uniref:NAD-dependent succinate-semialdehyde dehydrogenase n=1 Tax=Dongia soli TaxID=600628 RepID=A0ABU5EHI4_9PROT|nr:NAD-dependent succinate-semialdehyde dehydrogenase [Dongia soli]MDY0885499.1 NAD-dependent succinate-semialdehyde dehydrogenase [Dongia soli]
MYPDTLLFIDGKGVQAADGRNIPVLNPATEEVIGHVAHAGRTDLEAAAQAAQKGFAIWRKVSAFDRSKIMRKAADLLRERADEIARVMTMEQGKPLAQSKMEVMAAPDIIDWLAEEARRTYGRIIPARAGNVHQHVLREPVGPVAGFSPWNFPINQATRKIGAALAAGCSIILKAPEETPAAPAKLVQAFADAGVPAGVINLVYGVPHEISEFLIPHPVIQKISFTGSTAIGKKLAGLAGEHMKRATMELGGHAPVIVFDDADLDATVAGTSGAKFRNAGQVCVSPTRFMVQEATYDRFVEKFVAAAKQVKVGNGLDAETAMGPLANSRRIPALESLIQDAVKHGAKVLTGGNRIGNRGYFFEPTVLVDVPKTARVMNEEPFGPVALISKFSDKQEAFTEANRLPYGLAAYVFTRSMDRANSAIADIESGMVSVNHFGLGLPEVPFGGIKDSGYGSEGGSEAIEPYLNTKYATLMSL